MTLHTSQSDAAAAHADLLDIAARAARRGDMSDAIKLRLAAVQYRRMERALDELAENDREDQAVAHRVAERAARAEQAGQVRADAAAELRDVLARWRRG